MVRVKEKKKDIDVCAESRKAAIRNSKFLLDVYEHTIARNLSKKRVDIAPFKVTKEIQNI